MMPQSGDRRAKGTKEGRMTQQPTGEPIDILLVEDNEAHAELVMRGLKDHRILNQVHHVPDGEAALQFLRREGKWSDPGTSPRPHVVLLDLRLPKVDGLEVLSEIKGDEALRSIPVVVLTTSEAERDVALVKPVEFASFTKLMDDLGFYWLAWNKTAG
jgi:CheY-like chemotaxis protein